MMTRRAKLRTLLASQPQRERLKLTCSIVNTAKELPENELRTSTKCAGRRNGAENGPTISTAFLFTSQAARNQDSRTTASPDSREEISSCFKQCVLKPGRLCHSFVSLLSNQGCQNPGQPQTNVK